MNNLLTIFANQYTMPLWALCIIGVLSVTCVVISPFFIVQTHRAKTNERKRAEIFKIIDEERKRLAGQLAEIETQKAENEKEIELLKQVRQECEAAKQALEETIAELENEKKAIEEQTLELKRANTHRQGLLSALKSQTENIKKEKKALNKAKKKSEENKQ